MLSKSDIAVIGMAGKFPKAGNIEIFWENLKSGKHCLGDVPQSRFDNWKSILYEEKKDYPFFGYLEDIDGFDADFFNTAPGETAFIDPGQRLILETVHQALEFGGYGGKRLANTRTGVFIACGDSGYRHLISASDYSKNTEVGNLSAVSAGRISHFFDLRGPSLLIDTACSSSLAALHYACESLKRGECSLAIVGAVNVYAYLGGKADSSDTGAGPGTTSNHCRVFDDSANGMLNGEGVGALLLKPLPRALKDSDVICAVIKGTAVNHHGARTVTIAGQKSESLAEVMKQALENARTNPGTLSYIEASGAASKMGDQIEIKAITDVFSNYTEKKQFCAIGSVKSNIGHLNHTSGLASIIKVILALRHKQIPPQARYEKPNSYIDFKNSPVYIETKLKNWELGKNNTRRAGISSFSVNGTNCHIILEEAPPQPEPAAYPEHFNILTISAKNPTTLKKLCSALREYIKKNSFITPDDLCYTMNTGRGHYRYRLAVVGKNREEFIDGLNAIDYEGQINGKEAGNLDILSGNTGKSKTPLEPKAVFLFPGDKDLTNLEKTCRDFYDKGFLAGKYMDECRTFFPLEKYPQVLAFAFQYALARLWMDLGIKPAFVLGFGIGKYVSKVISGTLKLEEALKICVAEYNRENFLNFNKSKLTHHIAQLYSRGQKLFLEMGYENELGKMTEEVLRGKPGFRVLLSYDTAVKEKTLLRSIGHVYTWGVHLDFPSLFYGRKVELPIYPFHRQRYWVKAGTQLKENNISRLKTSSLQTPPAETVPYAATLSRVEETLTRIWQTFFGIEKIRNMEDFFQVGGDSLKAMTVISEIHKELHVSVPLAEFFNRPTIRELAQYISKAEKSTFSSIEPVEKREYYPLSPAQRRLYILYQISPETTAYNSPSVSLLQGHVDKDRIENTFKDLLKRHESFRTSFCILEEEAVQRIHQEVEFQVEYCKTGNGERPDPSDLIRPFTLSTAPLLRVGLIRVKEQEHILVVDMHHIIADGLSHPILIQDFTYLYACKELSPLRLQYKDFSVWRNRDEQIKALKSQREYWLKEFEGEIPVLHLPTDYTRPTVQSFEGSTGNFEIDRGETRALNQLAKKQGTTLYIVLLAAFNVLLARLSNQEDIIIGTPVAGRRHADLEHIIGMSVNTLTMRNYPNSEKVFTYFLQEVKENTLKAFENQDYPFEELVEQVGVVRDVSRNPLFDVMFALQNMDFPEVEIPGLKLSPYEHKSRISKFDLELSAVEAEGKLLFSYEYCTKLFKQETIEKFVFFYKKIISSILDNPYKKISQIEIISDEEKKKILFNFNDTDAEYPENKTIHELFKEQAERTPHNIAVIGVTHQLHERESLGGTGGLATLPVLMSITYKELNEKSDNLAHLLQTKNVKPDTIVGIMAERSVEMIIGILGILKAGGAYLPIDPGYPEERVNYMLIDSCAKVLITTRILFEDRKIGKWENRKNLEIVFPDFSTLPSFHLHLSPVPATSLAYVIYTSGSTGSPKGSMIEHTGMMNHIHAKIRDLRITGESIIAQNASHTFDISIWQFFSALTRGGKTVIYTNEVILEPGRFINQVMENRVTILEVVPSYLSLMLDSLDLNPGRFEFLEYLLVTGEEVKQPLLERWFKKYPGIKVVNAYGPTEASDDITHHIMDSAPGEKCIPIGKPLHNLNIYIVDQHMNLCPPGVKGEICVSGIGVGRGYLNNPGLTFERFINYKLKNTNYNVQNYKTNGIHAIMQPCIHASMQSCSPAFPFTPLPHHPIYLTGDIGRWLGNGAIEFFGRKDNQVKIRGFRIELGEIETQLVKHEAVKEAVVVDREDEPGSKYLCAYLVPRGNMEVSAIKAYLSGCLPGYMVPAYFVTVEKLPLTPNGKIDRKALPGIEFSAEKKYTGPRNTIEKILVEIMGNVLGQADIGIDENFFEIGGDSIRAIQITSRMYKAGYKIEMRDIFQEPTISGLAPKVKKLERIADQSVITGRIPLTPIQREFFQKIKIDPHHFNLAVMLYSKEGFGEQTTREVFKKIQEHHDALRVTYTENNGEIIQTNHGLDYPFSLEVYDFRGRPEKEETLEALTAKANEIQAGIDLEKGPLMKLGLFQLADGERLLIVIHHLVVDGVSWRTLFEDIETLYHQYKNKESLLLPRKTDSFKVWVEKLSEYAQSETFLKEKDFWAALEAQQVPDIEKDFTGGNNLVKDAEHRSFSLNEDETLQLLTGVNNAFGTDINDILLTALGLALCKTYGHNNILIELEGHGREEILKHVSVNRTIGWFTSLFPVVFDFSHAADLSRQIIEVKETLRRLPNGGIGYGILKYLTGERYKKGIEFKLKPQVSFNYLGQFDADVRQMSFEVAGESPGNTCGSETSREHELEVSGMVARGRLKMSIIYSKKQYKTETMERLLNQYQQELTRIISFCTGRKEPRLTPSDLTYPHLSIETLEQLKAKYPISDIYVLSPMQEGMLFHALYEKDSAAYFEQFSYRLHGHLEIACLEQSLKELLKRYDILRTAFVYEGLERPLQVVLKERKPDFLYEDLGEIIGEQASQDEKEAYIKEFKRKNRQQSFDPGKDVLIRAAVFKVDQSEYEFTWSFHHILMDGWCVGILVAEYLEIYNSYLENRSYVLPPVKPYRTYIQWLQNRDSKESQKYWSNYLEDYEEMTGLPRIKVKEEAIGYKNQFETIILEEEGVLKLDQLAGRTRVTINTITQTIWGVVLGRYSSSRDVVFGAVVSGRPTEIEGVESMVGLFINTIPVRIEYRAKITFSQLLKKVQDNAVESESHHYYPLALIQSASHLKNNLLDHVIIFENYPIAEQIDGAVAGKGENRSGSTFRLSNIDVFEQTNYDFNVVVIPGGRITIKFHYNGNVFDHGFVRQVAGHFKRLLEQVLDNGEQTIDELEVLSKGEKDQLLHQFNNNRVEYPGDKTLHQLLEKQVEITPDHIALLYQDTRLTYRELNKKACQLAGTLREQGVTADTIVGIMVETSVEMILGIIAVLKAGGAYLPLDPGSPRSRITYMLDDCGVNILLSRDNTEDRIPFNGKCIHLDQEDCYPPGYSNLTHINGNQKGKLAYIIYTSGSVGKPKGVTVEHLSIVNTLSWRKNYYKFNPDDTSLQIFSYTFDGSLTDIFTPLTSGSRLVLIPGKDLVKLDFLKNFIKSRRITNFIITPHFYGTILDEDDIHEYFKVLKSITIAGESFSTDLVKKHFHRLPGTKLVNEYGPTENSVCSTVYELKQTHNRVLIGTPINNVRCYILDKNRRLSPIGVTGELTLSGAGVVRGYLNMPELTGERFMKDPFVPGQMMYRSGDLGRRLADGNLEFLGRADHQVKIRGYRIELQEIESCLTAHDNIIKAVVLAKSVQNSKTREEIHLVAYVVPYKTFDINELRGSLRETLPDYMIPTYFVVLEEFPLTSSGKIHRQALPDPREAGMGSDIKYAAPGNTIETLLLETWRQVLGRDKIGIHDDFFMMGGDSIKSIQIAARMNKTGYRVEIKDIFSHPTIAQLAKVTRKTTRIPVQSTVTGPVPLIPIQKMFFELYTTDTHHFNQAVMLHSVERFETKAVRAIFQKLQEHHDALRMTYREGNKEIIQTNHGLDYPLSIREYDLRQRKDAMEILEAEANQIQASINLETGPLMKVGLFHLDDGDRLLIVIHHLVVDGVSWRILFEDIETLHQQYKEGKPFSLPPKSDPLKLWAEMLREYTNRETLLEEKAYWKQLNAVPCPGIKKDFENISTIGDTAQQFFTLSHTETHRLLTRVNHAFNTEINDILLTALALALKKTFHIDGVPVVLEGHGREEIFPELDITRTVGWFTCTYPVLLETSSSWDLARQIKEIKERLRQVPNRGIGFGILQYLTSEVNKKDLDFIRTPQISFNYLGQFDADVNRMSFEVLQESTGASRSEKGSRFHQLEVNGMITGMQLQIAVTYGKNEYKAETIQMLLENYKTGLERVIGFCAAREESEPTPGDFMYCDLNIDQLDRLNRRYRVQDIYPLSPMQEGMLFHSLYDKHSSAYFEQTAYRISGKPDVPLIQKSLNRLFQRHDVLRTVIVHEGMRQPLQIVLKEQQVEFYYENLQGMTTAREKETYIEDFKKENRRRTFDLSQDRPFRAAVLQLDEETYEFILSFHHVLMDGWCIGILTAEYLRIYHSLQENQPLVLPEVKPYRIYIQWLQTRDKKAAHNYWSRCLENYEEMAGLPRMAAGKDARGYKNQEVTITLEEKETRQLNQLAGRSQVTVNTFIQVVWALVLGRHTSRRDVVFGAVVSGRPSEIEGVESMVGLFINTIPVRIRYEGKTRFDALLKKAQENALASEPHHHYSLTLIQSATPLKENLINHIFVFENFPIAQQIDGLTAGENQNRSGPLFKFSNIDVFEQTNYDLNVIVILAKPVIIKFDYNGNVFDADYIRQVANHFKRMLVRVLDNEKQHVDDLEILSEEEKHQLLYRYNGTRAEYPRETLHRLFEIQVEKTPDQTTLLYDDTQLTYGELNKKAGQLAAAIRARGVTAETIAALMIERSIERVLGMIAVLKAGGAYLPVDPAAPGERIKYMLADSGARVLLTTPGTRDKANVDGKFIEKINISGLSSYSTVTANSTSRVTPANLAYTIYTSGTTGRPKGVLVEHRSAVNEVCWFGKSYLSKRDKHVLMMWEYTFDPSMDQIFGTLLYGSVLYIVDKELLFNIGGLRHYIRKHQVQILDFVPAGLNELLGKGEKLESLQAVISGGERLDEAVKNRIIQKGYTLYNLYGLTETTVDALVEKCSREKVTLGAPIFNVNCYILDRYNHLTPIGVVGELAVGGDGVTRGYLNQPELTSGKFIRNPFVKGQKIYRTGDLAKMHKSGKFEFLGRIDRQVKIRGFRIETIEIESLLGKHEKITDTAVLAQEDKNKEKYLCAYIVTDHDQQELPVKAVREYLKKHLPAYMIPAYFIKVKSIPLTPNGKVDRQALPLPGNEIGEEYILPKTKNEKAIAEIWKEILETDRVGIDQNFFDIGGDSIKAIRLNSRLNELLGKNISIVTLFERVTIRSFIEYLNQTGTEARVPESKTGERIPGSSLKRPDVINKAREIKAKRKIKKK
jgi:iturin family lipopeptide synthetase B